MLPALRRQHTIHAPDVLHHLFQVIQVLHLDDERARPPQAPLALSLTELLSASTEELRQAVNSELMTVTVQGITYPLRPILAGLRELHSELAEDLASPASEDAGVPAEG